MKTHILPHVICSDVITEGRARTKNLLDAFLHVSRNDSDVFVETSRVMSADVMASNGVMHVVSDVILPDSGETNRQESSLNIFKHIRHFVIFSLRCLIYTNLLV